MKIVDCRNKETDLVKFADLPHFAVFELPDEDGLFIKYEVPAELTIRSGYAGITPNTFRITDSSNISDRLWWKIVRDKLVRPLEVELHIKGVKKYD
jgi:hypothetical protein